MKKKIFKNLNLNKKSISDLEITGGLHRYDSSVNTNETHEKVCSNYICDSRLGGCPSYYCY